jgi:Ca2+-binding EF-hand superfamily protein
MALPLLLIAAAAMQAAPATVTATPRAQHHFLGRGGGRSFMSPMGETFSADTAGEDGLIAWFRQADRNHDGSVTADEMTADAQRFFGVLDMDHDGEIGPDEITHYEEAMEARSGRYSLLNIPEPVVSADADFNRGVSADEFRATALKRFQRLDVNGAGRLTLPELQGIREAAAAQAKHPPGERPPQVQMDPDGDTQGAMPQ